MSASSCIAVSQPQSPGSEWEPVTFGGFTPNGKLRVRAADLHKIGVEGYIHGFICVRPPCGKYSEASRETHGGKTVNPGTGQVIGRDLKKDSGDFGYSIKYFSPGVKTGHVLGGQYATRQDASRAAVMLHNVELMRDEPGITPAFKDLLDMAAQYIHGGDHRAAADALIKSVMEAKPVENEADKNVGQHIMMSGMFEALKGEGRPIPQVHVDASLPSHERIAAAVPVNFGDDVTWGDTQRGTVERITRAQLAKQAQLVPGMVKDLDAVRITTAGFKGNERGLAYTLGVAPYFSLHPTVFTRQARESAVYQRTSGFWVPVTPQDSHMANNTVSHEVGHLIASRAFGSSGGPSVKSFWDALANALDVKPPDENPEISATEQYLTHDNVVAWLKDPTVSSHVRNRVSKYATTNPQELLAELWCEFSANDAPRVAAQFYGNYVTQAMASRGIL